jgi:hypothetical protein
MKSKNQNALIEELDTFNEPDEESFRKLAKKYDATYQTVVNLWYEMNGYSN